MLSWYNKHEVANYCTLLHLSSVSSPEKLTWEVPSQIMQGIVGNVVYLQRWCSETTGAAVTVRFKF